MAGKKEYELAVKIAGMVDASLGQLHFAFSQAT